MGVPNLEVGYTSATTGRGVHEVHKGHVVALREKKHHICTIFVIFTTDNTTTAGINPLNAQLNPTCHLLALLGAHHILHVSWLMVNYKELYDCKWDPITLKNNNLYTLAFTFL
jgi:hypothetical protein